MEKNEIAKTIEHTALKPAVSLLDIEILCREARQWNFFGVCVNSVWIEKAAQLLKGSAVKVVSVAGFPLGANATEVKRQEIEFALSHGAHEVDFVMNIGWMKGKDYEAIKREFTELVKAASSSPLKVILETCLLSDEEKNLACQMALDCGVAFVKTSTGFSHGGATIEDVKLMKAVVDGKAGIKAAGGIRDIQTALSMLAAGADRLGTSSGVTIMQGVGDEYINETY